MEDKNTVSMKEQRLHRQRINHIKTSIIMIVGGCLLISMIFCIVLLVQIIRLDHKIDRLEADVVSIGQRAEENSNMNGAANKNEIQSQNVEGTEASAADDNVEADAANEYNSTTMDNLAQEGVRQKVYLTFDDGPSQNTAKILDILKEKGIKATFFVIGNEDENAKELYQRIVAEGHTLGMHSYSHKYSVIYNSLEAFQDDFNQLRTYLTEITGVEPTIMRFPGGSSNQVSNIDMKEFIRYLNQEEIRYYDWNVASGDATSQAYTTEELIENVIRDVEKYDTSIVLMHDSSTKGTTVEALGPMIDQLEAMDVELLPIDDNTRMIQHISADSINE